MAQAIPETTKQWNVVGTSGFDSLKFSEQPVPELGDNDVLVRSRAYSSPLSDNILTVHSQGCFTQCKLMFHLLPLPQLTPVTVSRFGHSTWEISFSGD